MEEEPELVETTIDPAGETPTEPTEPQQPPATDGDVEARIARMEAALKKANSEAAKYRKQAEAFEKAEQDRKQAEMTEAEKLKAQLEQAEAARQKLEGELKQREIAEAKRNIAAKVGLPEALASRLQGETPEEMEADAVAILEILPKQPETAAKPKQPQISPTNPGVSATGQETDAQKRARLFGSPADVFDPGVLRAKGGGAFIVEK